LDPPPRSEITRPEVLGDDETAELPRVRWRFVALGVAAGMPGVALLCVFAEHADLVFRVISVVAGISALAATVLTLRFVELPPASAAFLAAADPTRPLDESSVSAGAAFSPAKVGPRPEPHSASPTPEPLSAPALTPEDSVPARELVGQLLFRRTRQTGTTEPGRPDRRMQKP
jgi:hypothetical protein